MTVPDENSNDIASRSPSPSPPSSAGSSWGPLAASAITHATSAWVCIKVASQLGAALLELMSKDQYGTPFYVMTVGLVAVAVPTSARDLLALARKVLGSGK